MQIRFILHIVMCTFPSIIDALRYENTEKYHNSTSIIVLNWKGEPSKKLVCQSINAPVKNAIYHCQHTYHLYQWNYGNMLCHYECLGCVQFWISYHSTYLVSCLGNINVLYDLVCFNDYNWTSAAHICLKECQTSMYSVIFTIYFDPSYPGWGRPQQTIEPICIKWSLNWWYD